MQQFDVVVLGAGAAGMMCAIEAGRRGRRVLVLDHAAAPGEKIRISGGGRCNFTNREAGPKNFLSANPHFARSALARYTPRDFIALVDRHAIAWHEKTLGQLFCDGSARQIVAMLTKEMTQAGVRLELGAELGGITRAGERFGIASSLGSFEAESLVVATGGKSIPKMGATGIAYRIAESFGIGVVETRPGLVPLTLDPAELSETAELAGVSVDCRASHGRTDFREAALFTHRGLSGPAILQISSFWREGDEIALAFMPDRDIFGDLKAARAQNGRQALETALSAILPRRLAQLVLRRTALTGALADQSDKKLSAIAEFASAWRVKPAGSEGYRTAEVTLGGIDTDGLDQKTMAARTVPGLFFIGECVDVTGWLGGYNFQWAWASGHAAGQSA